MSVYDIARDNLMRNVSFNFETTEEFVSEVLDELFQEDKRFFVAPASASGRYHPTDECAEFGLIRHTIRCVHIGYELSIAHDLTEKNQDIVVAGCVLHDILAPSGKGHAERAAEFINHVAKGCEYDAHHITNAVKYHMGPWTTPSIKKPMTEYTETELIVYHADFISSRRDIKDIWKFKSLI